VIGPFQELPLKPSADRIWSFGAAFGWSKVATVNVSSVGVHVVNLWMREDVADKIVLHDERLVRAYRRAPDRERARFDVFWWWPHRR